MTKLLSILTSVILGAVLAGCAAAPRPPMGHFGQVGYKTLTGDICLAQTCVLISAVWVDTESGAVSIDVQDPVTVPPNTTATVGWTFIPALQSTYGFLLANGVEFKSGMGPAGTTWKSAGTDYYAWKFRTADTPTPLSYNINFQAKGTAYKWKCDPHIHNFDNGLPTEFKTFNCRQIP